VSELIRVGVIGCGSVAEKYIPHLHRLNYPHPRIDITMTCDIRPELRQTVRDRYGIEAFTTDERAVIESPDIDLILVLTSMPEHGRLAKAALLAGKHVLVEKPMAMTLPEAAELVELAKTCPGYLVCAPHVVLSKTYQSMWRRVHDGDIGKVYSARGFYGWAGPSWGPFFYQPGGGAMFDLGVYNVTTLTGLLGPAKRIVALSGIAIPERVVNGAPMRVETDDNAQLLLDFGDACYAVVTTGFTIQQYNVPGIELYGATGTLQMIGEDWAPRGYELWQNHEGCWRTYRDQPWPWTDGIRHLVECIEQGVTPVITPEHAYHVLEIMLKSMESGRTGRALAIESSFEPVRFDRAPVLGVGGHLVHDADRDS
jgi:predicted dehydrogenase